MPIIHDNFPSFPNLCPIFQYAFKLSGKKLIKCARCYRRYQRFFLPKKVIFSSKCACISSTILTFLPNNPVCFYTKNSQKVNFSSNCDYNTGHFIDFSSKKSDFFLKMRLHIEHYFDFFAQLSSVFLHQKFPKS